MTDKLINAVKAVAELEATDKQKLGKKHYTMVHTRVTTFRAHLGMDGRIETEIVDISDKRVMVKATVYVWRNEMWVEIANDFAEEYRGNGPVNKTSAVENCCTSAIGRALSAAGLSGGEYASAFEVDNAINNKESAEDVNREDLDASTGDKNTGEVISLAPITKAQQNEITDLVEETGSDMTAVLAYAGAESVDQIPAANLQKVMGALHAKLEKANAS